MRKLFNSISVYLAAVFMLSMVVGCSHPTPMTLPKLAIPVVTIGSDGIATWDSVDNAIYYVYVIDEGDEKLTDECHVQLAHNDSVKVKAVSGSEQYDDSDFSRYKAYIKPADKTQLSTPSVSISSSGVAAWGAIDNAQYYYYVVNNGIETKTTDRSVQLAENDTIKVKAGSDDTNYNDSDYSRPVTYTKGVVQIKLSTPSVSVSSSGVATWGAIDNAQYYLYTINNGAETKTTDRSVQLTNNQTIKVKASSDSAQYTDSDYSQSVTYTQGVVQIKLSTPSVSVSSSGVATWVAIGNAQYYYYVVNNGTETKTTNRSVQLEDRQTIKVKACSDDSQYTDSDYSQLKTYVKSTTPPQPDHPLSAEVQAYYSVITADGGNALLGQLHDRITDTHDKYTTYTDCKTPSLVMLTDKGSAPKTVMDFYTQQDISSTWNGNAAGTWNREHVWCQSLSNGLWGETGGGSDMHHLRPSEVRLNGTRSNNKFGKVNGGTVAYYKDTDGKNKYAGGWVSGSTFEPLDKVKGDVARIVMYVYTHYNNYANVYGTTNGNGHGGYFGKLNFTYVMSSSSESTAIKLLLEWNAADPVDEIEIARNDAVYKIQGNRNPFIDHPEYANAIWG